MSLHMIQPSSNSLIADSTNKRYCTDADKVVIGNTSGVNSGDQLHTVIGDSTNNTDYFLIASWTLAGAWSTIVSNIKVLSTSKLGVYDLGILASLDGSGAAFSVPVFKIKDTFGTIGQSTFRLTYNNATGILKLFFKDSTQYEPHQIVRIDSILNSNTVSYSNTDIGTTLPTETGTVTPTVS